MDGECHNLGMPSACRSRFIIATDWIAENVIPLSLFGLTLALASTIVPVNTDPPLLIIGAATFVIAILINGRTMMTREMKSIEKLGFNRVRDYYVYNMSSRGMDRRLMAVAIIALITTFVVSSGAIGKAAGGGSVLAISIFALIGSITRLKRIWPSDEYLPSER